MADMSDIVAILDEHMGDHEDDAGRPPRCGWNATVTDQTRAYHLAEAIESTIAQREREAGARAIELAIIHAERGGGCTPSVSLDWLRDLKQAIEDRHESTCRTCGEPVSYWSHEERIGADEYEVVDYGWSHYKGHPDDGHDAVPADGDEGPR